VEEFGKTNDAMLQYFVGFEADARRELRSVGVPDHAIADIINGMKKGMKHSTALALRRSDATFVEAARAYLGVLIEHEGRWTVNAEGDVEFAEEVPDSALDAFSQAGDEVLRIADHQDTLFEDFRRE
jgi:hypothetical protein